MKNALVLVSIAAACAVTPAFADLSDDCATATVVTAGGAFPFNLATATNDGTASCGFSAVAPDKWARLTSPTAGTVTFSTCGANFDTVLTIFDGCGGAELACNDDSCGFQSSITVLVGASSTVWVRIAGYDGEVGSGSLTISAITPQAPGHWDERVNGGGDASNLPASAQAITGSGSLTQITGSLIDTDAADMYRIRICDEASFSASVVDGTEMDSQLFLFNPNGVGVAFNDDSQDTVQSTLTSQFVTANGTYYLAIAGYDSDPLDSGGMELWEDEPFDVQRAPDGPGAANPVASWSGDGDFDIYTITLTGACRGGAPQCVADMDDGTGSGTPDGGVGIEDLLFYLSVYDAGVSRADVDDGTGSGTPDGGVGIEDLLYYLLRYDMGC